jgi:hypothetical protein
MASIEQHLSNMFISIFIAIELMIARLLDIFERCYSSCSCVGLLEPAYLPMVSTYT